MPHSTNGSTSSSRSARISKRRGKRVENIFSTAGRMSRSTTDDAARTARARVYPAATSFGAAGGARSIPKPGGVRCVRAVARDTAPDAVSKVGGAPTASSSRSHRAAFARMPTSSGSTLSRSPARAAAAASSAVVCVADSRGGGGCDSKRLISLRFGTLQNRLQRLELRLQREHLLVRDVQVVAEVLGDAVRGVRTRARLPGVVQARQGGSLAHRRGDMETKAPRRMSRRAFRGDLRAEWRSKDFLSFRSSVRMASSQRPRVSPKDDREVARATASCAPQAERWACTGASTASERSCCDTRLRPWAPG